MCQGQLRPSAGYAPDRPDEYDFIALGTLPAWFGGFGYLLFQKFLRRYLAPAAAALLGASLLLAFFSGNLPLMYAAAALYGVGFGLFNPGMALLVADRSSRILPVVGEVIFSLLTMPLVYYFFEFFFKENLDTLDHYDLYHRCDPPRWRRYPACYQKKDEGRIITLLYSHT